MHASLLSRLPLLALAAGAFVACTPPSQTDCALELDPPRVMVHAEVDELRIVQREASQELGRMLGARAGRGRALGLTEATPSYLVEIDVKTQAHSGGGVCAAPDVAVTLRYKDLRIGIAREIAPGSCRYRETLEHELRHVQAYQAHIEQVRTRLERSLSEALLQQGARLYADESSAQELLAQDVMPRVARLTTKLMSTVTKAHRAIDTPEEYARLAEVCEHEPIVWEDEAAEAQPPGAPSAAGG